MRQNSLKLLVCFIILCLLFSACKKECYPTTERYFETRFKKNGKTTDPGYTHVYAPGGKGNIPLQETRYGEYFYCLPIPLGKDEVTYYFEKNSTKDSIKIGYNRVDEFQSEKCGKIIRYSNPEVLSASFSDVDAVIENAKIADNDIFKITIII